MFYNGLEKRNSLGKFSLVKMMHNETLEHWVQLAQFNAFRNLTVKLTKFKRNSIKSGKNSFKDERGLSTRSGAAIREFVDENVCSLNT